MPNQEPQEKKRFKFKREIDPVAALALVLSLGFYFYLLIGWWRGVNIEIFPPNQVLITSYQFPGEDLYVVFGARMAYVSKGRAGFNEIVVKEKIAFSIGNNSYEQAWQHFVWISAKGSQLKEDFISSAHPFQVIGGSSTAHETRFSPRSIRCSTGDTSCEPNRNFLKFQDFIERIKGLSELEFRFQALLSKGELKVASCKIVVDKNLISALTKDGWFAPACWED